MEQIRVKRGIEIGVNDQGDSIIIDVENAEWMVKYNKLIENLSSISKDIEKEAQSDHSESEQIDIICKTMRKVMTEVDKIFGENACRKIFGDIVPTPFAFVDFFEQLTPIVNRYAEERNKMIEQKYNTNRKGGRK